MSEGSLDYGNSKDFLVEEMRKMGIQKGTPDYDKYRMAMFGWADFAEYWFCNPDDDDKPLHLEPAQRAAINAVQFGYDIEAYPWIIPAAKRPKEIVMIWPRQFGKSTAVAIAAACAFIFMQRRYKIGMFSINLDGAVEVMDKIRLFIETSPFAYMIEKSNQTEIIKKGGKVKCTSYPASEGVRGRSLNLGLIDEAAKIPQDILSGVILWTLRRVGERWILLSTPRGFKGDFIHHYQTGMKTRPITCTHCRTEFLQESETMKEHMADFTSYIIPKLPPCPVCAHTSWVYGVGAYNVVPVDPWNCSWTTPEKIRQELDFAGWTPLARQELLGEIIFEGANVFSREMLMNATNKKLANEVAIIQGIKNYVMGVDFGKIHDRSVASINHYDWNTKKFKWDYMKSMGGEYDDKNYATIRRSFLDLVLLYNPIWVVPDSTGVGDAIVEDMSTDLTEMRQQNGWLRTKIFSNKPATPNMPIKVQKAKKKHLGFVFDTQSKQNLIENVVEGYTVRRDIEIPGYDVPEARDYWDECMAFSYEVTEKKKNIVYGTQAAHDDRIIAHALAYWVGRQKPFIGISSTLA